MIVRHYIKCLTCDHPHTLRIQVGHNPYQEHCFKCMNCEEDIVVGMDCDVETASVQIREIDNCERGTDEGCIINLSPDFPIAPEELHKDFAFPSIRNTQILIQEQEKLGLKHPSFTSLDEVKAHASIPGYSELWPIVKKGWSLTTKGLTELAEKIFENYKPPNFNDPKQLNFVLFHFCCHMLFPGKYNLFENAANLTANIAKNHEEEYNQFKIYYINNIKDHNLNRYFEVFNEFFKCYSDFSQTLTYAQHSIELPDDFEASSTAFGKTKLFYGNAFESLTSNISVLACLNNVHHGRKFDQFDSMTLNKYMTINKAKRANPFKDTLPYYEICRYLDSTLRNASHHGAMSIDNSGRRIRYQSGGTGSIRTMSYKEYIDKCNAIMLSSCALLSMELAIAF